MLQMTVLAGVVEDVPLLRMKGARTLCDRGDRGPVGAAPR